MLRRCAASLALLGFIAGQLASLPHAHGSVSLSDQHQHDSWPHFHLGHGKHSQSHSHSHSHAHGDASKRKKCNCPSDGFDKRSHHDSDRVDLPTGASDVTAGAGRHCAFDGASLKAVFPSPVTCLPLEAEQWPDPSRPPDIRPAACKIFLKLRTLRI